MSEKMRNIEDPAIFQAENNLAGLCAELFLLVIKLKNSVNTYDPHELRRIILFLIEILRKRCKASDIDDFTEYNIVFPLICLLDEIILGKSGNCKDYWIVNPLQLELYGEMSAGDRFYNNLEDLMNEKNKRKDILEIYYLCLSFGFEGKYRLFCHEEKLLILQKIFTIIRNSRGNSPYKLIEIVEKKRENKTNKYIPSWLFIAVVFGIATIMYSVFLMRINLLRIEKLIIIFKQISHVM